MEGTCLLAMWCPVQSRRESGPGFRTELENLVDPVKGKRRKRQNREAESADGSARGGLLRSSEEAG